MPLVRPCYGRPLPLSGLCHGVTFSGRDTSVPFVPDYVGLQNKCSNETADVHPDDVVNRYTACSGVPFFNERVCLRRPANTACGRITGEFRVSQGQALH